MGCYERVKSWRHHTKNRMVMAFGGECGICGYNKCIEAFDFHHLDPDIKEFSFQSMCRSWEKTVSELRKCIMVCANCHREIHYNAMQIPENVRKFDESYVSYKPEKTFDECPICGNLKNIALLTCSLECARKKRNKVDWDNYNLKELYDNIGSFAGIARHIGGISDGSVKKRMIKQGLL